jgi:signal peptidase I
MPARYATVLVEGDSMLPTYNSGDWLLARWGSFSLKSQTGLLRGIFSGGIFSRGISVDNVVVIELANQPGIFYVKRVSKIDREKHELYLLSDNPEGTDSRQWGWLPISSARAKVLCRVRKTRVR